MTPWHWFWQHRDGYPICCAHRSHRLRLPCLRWRTYDGFCGRHNASCFHGCGKLL